MTDSVDVKERALALLARREHSYIELKRKLVAKGVDATEADEVLCVLREEGLQSDDRFSEHYVTVRSGRGYGPIRIEAELRERGVFEEVSQVYLEEHDWVAQGVEVRTKRFGEDLPRDFTSRAKQMRFLQYRGFTADHIKQILDGQTVE